MSAAGPSPAANRHRHLRARGDGAQDTTTLELFFDLVYVLAVTQLSHLLLTHLSWTARWHMAFLLLVVWWAWIYTTWMVKLAGPAVDAGPDADRGRACGPVPLPVSDPIALAPDRTDRAPVPE